MNAQAAKLSESCSEEDSSEEQKNLPQEEVQNALLQTFRLSLYLFTHNMQYKAYKLSELAELENIHYQTATLRAATDKYICIDFDISHPGK